MTVGRSRGFWWGAGAGAAVLIVLLGWFVGIGPQLTAGATARTDAGDLRSQNQVLSIDVDKLERQQPGPLRSSLRAAVTALPYDSELPLLTRQLTQQARQHHVTLKSIVIGASAAVGGVAGGDPSAATGTLQAVPVTLSSTGLGANQLAFVRAIQVDGPRSALVSATQLSPRGGDVETIAGRSSMTTTLTVFVSPLTAAEQTRLEKLLSADGAS